MMRTVPKLTALQALVLTEIRDSPQLSESIRRQLTACGVQQSGPAFYQMMGRMIREDLVTAHDFRQEGSDIHLRFGYIATDKGKAELDAAIAFYASLSPARTQHQTNGHK